MKLQSLARTDCGKIRENNEDLFHRDDELGLYIVCDGVGGHQAGEVASEMATALICAFLEEHRDKLEEMRSRKTEAREWLAFGQEITQYASSRIFDKAQKDRRCRHMGTTMTLALAMKDRFLICHVGDSRLYLCNNSGTHLITEDHTLGHQMFLRGMIADESNYKGGNVLTRSMGMNPSTYADCQILEVYPGDRLILCSDGVSNYFDMAEEIDQVAAHDDISECLNGLISTALNRGGADNATAVIVEVCALQTQRDDIVQKLANKAISQFPLFCNLSYSQLMKLKSLMLLKEYKKGDQIIDKNDPIHGLYIIIEGAVAGDEEYLDTGECFGIRALIKECHSLDSRRASGNCKLLYLSREAFNSFASIYPRSGNKFYRNLLHNILE